MLNIEQQINRLKGLCGFTVAEILIAMVVLGLLGALTVPMLGQQKDKPWLKTKRLHGTVECYYQKDDSGEYKLRMFLSDNQDHKNGVELAEGEDDGNGNSNDGTACYFKMPNANAVIMQAVGAGGNGGTPPSSATIYKPGYRSNPTMIDNYIPVNDTFMATISHEDTPDWVRNEWNQQWDEARTRVTGSDARPHVDSIKYQVKSALGGGGNDVCRPTLRHFEPGSELANTCQGCAVGSAFTDTELCPTECTNKAGADGGNGAKGGIVEVTTKLYYSPSGIRDNVIFDHDLKKADDTGDPVFGQVTLKFNENKYVTLLPSSRGVNAYIPDLIGDAVGRTGNVEIFDGKTWNKDELYTYGGNVVGTEKNLRVVGDLTVSNIRNTEDFNLGRTKCGENGVTAERYTAGSISVLSPIQGINYKTSEPGIQTRFGLAGEPGTTTRLYFENIPMGTEYKLVPAKDNTQTSQVLMKKDDNWDPIFIANSGDNGEYKGSTLLEQVSLTTLEDFPFPKQYYPESFKPKKSELSVAGGANYRSKLAELLNDSNFNPGESGYGMYPLVTSVSGSARHIINNVITGDGDSLPPLIAPEIVTECLDGTEPLSGGWMGARYCGDPESETMKGKPGAAVISW